MIIKDCWDGIKFLHWLVMQATCGMPSQGMCKDIYSVYTCVLVDLIYKSMCILRPKIALF